MAAYWDGRAWAFIDDGNSGFGYVTPAPGAMAGITWIQKAKGSSDLGFDFANFALDAKRQSCFGSKVRYGTGNVDAVYDKAVAHEITKIDEIVIPALHRRFRAASVQVARSSGTRRSAAEAVRQALPTFGRERRHITDDHSPARVRGGHRHGRRSTDRWAIASASISADPSRISPLFDEETQSLKTLKVFSRPDEPGAEVLEGVRLVGERYGIPPAGHQLLHAWHHGRHQHRHPAQGAQARAVHHRAFPRRARDRAAQDPRHVQPAVEAARAADPARHASSASPGACRRTAASGSELDEASVEAAGRGRARGRRRGHRDLASCTPIAIGRMSCRPRRSSSGSRPTSRCSARARPGRSSANTSAPSRPSIGGYVQPRVAHYLGSLQAGAEGCRRSGRSAPDQVERRRDDRRAGQERMRADDPVGHGVGRHRRELCRRDLRHRALHEPRHRRHLARTSRSSSTASRNTASAS